jgi:hypothetical protein
MKIYMSDIRNAKMCARGTRAFFMLHGLDFQDFIKNGIDAEIILSTQDAMAIQVVELKYGRK